MCRMQFVVDHVRMKDVLEYIRDVLRGYGAVIAEPPVASPGAVRCCGISRLTTLSRVCVI